MKQSIQELLSTQVPVKTCSKGHVIPRNGDPDPVTMKRIERPRLVCEVCALEASKGIRLPARAKPLRKGERVEGQDNFLDTVEALEIRRDGRVV